MVLQQGTSRWETIETVHAFYGEKMLILVASYRPSQEFLHFGIASQTSQIKQSRIIPSPPRCYGLRRGTLPQEPRGDISPAVRNGVVERVVTSPVLTREIGSLRKQVPIERGK